MFSRYNPILTQVFESIEIIILLAISTINVPWHEQSASRFEDDKGIPFIIKISWSPAKSQSIVSLVHGRKEVFSWFTMKHHLGSLQDFWTTIQASTPVPTGQLAVEIWVILHHVVYKRWKLSWMNEAVSLTSFIHENVQRN